MEGEEYVIGIKPEVTSKRRGSDEGDGKFPSAGGSVNNQTTRTLKTIIFLNLFLPSFPATNSSLKPSFLPLTKVQLSTSWKVPLHCGPE